MLTSSGGKKKSTPLATQLSRQPLSFSSSHLRLAMTIGPAPTDHNVGEDALRYVAELLVPHSSTATTDLMISISTLPLTGFVTKQSAPAAILRLLSSGMTLAVMTMIGIRPARLGKARTDL